MTGFMSEYFSVLEQHGSLTPRAVSPLRDATAIDMLGALPNVLPPRELLEYFRHVNGYDDSVCSELDLFEPKLAWDMYCLALDECVSSHALCDESDDQDYWPSGFLPILADGTGSCLLVNCIAASPTYGGVYDMSEGVGCNRVSNSLPEFFAASAAEVLAGLRRYERDTSTLAVAGKEYLERAAPIFGHSPYFSRPGRMDSQIVDWKQAHGFSGPPIRATS